MVSTLKNDVLFVLNSYLSFRTIGLYQDHHQVHDTCMSKVELLYFWSAWTFLPRCLRIVTVEDPPIPFSPFSLADCTMLSHFSFNDFVAIAFPDLAGDLDIQI